MLPAGPLSSNRIHTSRTDRPFLESLPLNPSTDSSETPWHAYIEGIVEGRVRRLPGFRSFHRVPDIYNQATRAFVRKVGAERVEQTAERLYRELRLGFHYKRRDCHYTCEGGSALIRTPHFELEVDLDLDPAEPRNYRLRTMPPLRNCNSTRSTSTSASRRRRCSSGFWAPRTSVNCLNTAAAPFKSSHPPGSGPGKISPAYSEPW